MNHFNYDDLREDPSYFENLGQNIWLMDDHRWAFYLWEKIREEHAPDTRFNLVHADYHWDHNDDIEEDEEVARGFLTASVEQLREWTAREGRPIIYDSFIAPAVRRRLLTSIHWYCKQMDEDNGFEESFLQQFDCVQYFYWSSDALQSANIQDPLIFDLCLDLFNRDDNNMWSGDLWSDQDIDLFLRDCQDLIHRAAVVTVSLSFGYSGSEADTRRLASIIVPRLLLYRETTSNPLE